MTTFYLGKQVDGSDSTYNSLKDHIHTSADIRNLLNFQFLYEELVATEICMMDIYQCGLGQESKLLFKLGCDRDGKRWDVTLPGVITRLYTLADYPDLHASSHLSSLRQRDMAIPISELLENKDLWYYGCSAPDLSLYPKPFKELKDMHLDEMFTQDISKSFPTLELPRYPILNTVNQDHINVCLKCMWCNLDIGRCAETGVCEVCERCGEKTMCAGAQYAYAN